MDQGSSPLTRGKLCRADQIAHADGIIPAHAGKTTPGPWQLRAPAGSSPLTRGKPSGPAAGLAVLGIIPAHAGKTPVGTLRQQFSRDHPRSRGENRSVGRSRRHRRGSSPLTRGKPDERRGHRFGTGIIPAHAGKTGLAGVSSTISADHPRSRGENSFPGFGFVGDGGSSPLTRGKPGGRVSRVGARWIIPAHAGKTQSCRRWRTCGGDHPRSRGENSVTMSGFLPSGGSSPLTRGKPDYPHGIPRVPGIIPAHAGKTKKGPT